MVLPHSQQQSQSPLTLGKLILIRTRFEGATFPQTHGIVPSYTIRPLGWYLRCISGGNFEKFLGVRMICGIKSETACFSVTRPYIFVVSIYTYAYVILWLFEQQRNRSLVHTEASFYLAELTFTNMEWYAALFISP